MRILFLKTFVSAKYRPNPHRLKMLCCYTYSFANGIPQFQCGNDVFDCDHLGTINSKTVPPRVSREPRLISGIGALIGRAPLREKTYSPLDWFALLRANLVQKRAQICTIQNIFQLAILGLL